MINENKFSQYGLPRSIDDIRGITIHETNNLTMTPDDYLDFFNNELNLHSTYHYIVDNKTIVQLMPDDYMVYHTGKNKDWGDQYSIAIAVCSSLNDSVFEQSLSNAIDLINKLLEAYSIDKSKVYFHRDFNPRVYDPKRLLDEFETSRNFIYQKL